MRKTAALALALFAASAPASAAERSFSVTSFDRIRVEGPYRVKLTTGVAPFARATGSGLAIDRLSVAVQGRTLVVSNNASAWGGYPGQAIGPVELEVGTHDLSQAWLNGSGALAIDKVKGLSFDLALQGSGSVAIGNASVDQLKLAVSGVGTVTVAGTAPRLTAIVRGTSSLDAAALATKDAVVGAEGPSTVKVSASNSVKIDARGIASVEVAGNPACTVNAQGSATVIGCR